MAISPSSLDKQRIDRSVVKTEEPSGCPNQPKLDPRVKRTHKLIEDALKELMKERPFEEISVADIADRATINRATFYAHYEDKVHLAETMLRKDLEHAVIERLAPPAPFGPEAVARVGAATFEFMECTLGNCPHRAAQFAANLGLTLQETLERTFLFWLGKEPHAIKQFRGVSEEVLANALAWCLYGAAIRWSRLPRRPDAELAARETVDIFFR